MHGNYGIIVVTINKKTNINCRLVSLLRDSLMHCTAFMQSMARNIKADLGAYGGTTPYQVFPLIHHPSVNY